MALPLGPFPYILTDGTLADANQVMANFNLLLNGVNGLAPLGVSTPGQTSNVRANLAAAGASVTVTADIVNVATALNGTSYTLVSYSQAFNGATTGAGGMDTGTMPTSGFVALYAIYNPTAPAVSILGTNANVSAPPIYGGANMPAGYVASALLGVWRTNATPALVAAYIRNRTFQYAVGVTVLNATSTNTGAPPGTALSLATSVPPNAVSFSGYVQYNPNGSQTAGIYTLNLWGDGVATTAPVYACAVVVPAAVSGAIEVPYPPIIITTTQTLYYQTASLTANLTAQINLSQYSW